MPLVVALCVQASKLVGMQQQPGSPNNASNNVGGSDDSDFEQIRLHS